MNSLSSKYTKITYAQALKTYAVFHKIENYDDLLKLDKTKTVDMIREFLVYQRHIRQLSLGRRNTLFAAIKLFYEMNDYEDGENNNINWNKLARYKGKELRRVVEDRPISREEIKKFLQYADLRLKVIILVLSSTGVRVGGLSGIHLKDMHYIEEYKLYRFKIYSEDIADIYYTFCTPECASTIQEYLQYREKHYGEVLTPNSPLIRTTFHYKNNITLSRESIKERVRTLSLRIGLRELQVLGTSSSKEERIYLLRRKRYEFQNCHGFRKFFDTEARKAGVYPDFVELMMGHKLLGVRSSYFKPDLEILLEGTTECNGYIQAINELTISDENRLKTENYQLKEKQKRHETRLVNLEQKWEEWLNSQQ